MSKLTKGNWEYHEYIPEGVTLNGTEYLISSGGEDVALARNEADARLIVAAPEMYIWLKRIVEQLGSYWIYNFTGIKELLARIDSKGMSSVHYNQEGRSL